MKNEIENSIADKSDSKEEINEIVVLKNEDIDLKKLTEKNIINHRDKKSWFGWRSEEFNGNNSVSIQIYWRIRNNYRRQRVGVVFNKMKNSKEVGWDFCGEGTKQFDIGNKVNYLSSCY